ncbi:LysR family transcriptional regulator [Ensifer sp.]|jgi:DNA-binding transcriptional LysR family regulator|uniref:LysR family transcriptional regulator n=1 Tax=Ensifer sp. TaxID=1872086 RepID=UPI002E143333|nr:LysR family transcriptional regulator [Ensifer sp.]
MSAAAWDDLKLFYHVATEGGLTGAAARTGLSAPTIGRRMLALERAIGRVLFIRSQQGYRLAHDGQILLEHVRAMRSAADSISDWHRDAFALPIVSVASDAWVSGFVADHAMEIRGRGDGFRFCCKHMSRGFDLTFREADVAILHEQPRSGNIAVRRSVNIAYAVYRAANLPERDDFAWISVGTESACSPAEKWVFQNREQQIHTWTDSPALVPRLIRNGAGRGVLPAFVGDSEPLLSREGGLIEGLTHPLWIAANDDDRHRPEVRTVIDRLAELLKREEAMFAGASV